ncbi:MAG TPA: S8 family serine peptidase, partial [Bacteroidia bacterium]|nr:S8 family serine peptidase [Bacteroidia bacterium]
EAATWTYLTTVADALGVILIAAAGNDATSTPYYPAASNHVIAVGATESNDTKASYSNYGSWIDLMAPGSGIYSTLPDGGDSYGTLSGTSMSCPLVAGVAALILSTSPSLNPSQVEVLLEGGCENISPQNPNYPGQLGAGRLNAYFSLSPMATFGQQPLAATLQVFPNVGDGLFQIKSDRNFHEQLAVEIYNTAGIKVDAVTLPAPSESGLIELNLRERLPDGAYILRFSDKSGPLQSVRVIITAAN